MNCFFTSPVSDSEVYSLVIVESIPISIFEQKSCLLKDFISSKELLLYAYLYEIFLFDKKGNSKAFY